LKAWREAGFCFFVGLAREVSAFLSHTLIKKSIGKNYEVKNKNQPFIWKNFQMRAYTLQQRRFGASTTTYRNQEHP
jgi:hypothetical protein